MHNDSLKAPPTVSAAARITGDTLLSGPPWWERHPEDLHARHRELFGAALYAQLVNGEDAAWLHYLHETWRELYWSRVRRSLVTPRRTA